MKRAVLLLVLLAAVARAAPAVLFQTAPGRFEIAATDAAAARPVLAATESAWRALARPLELPPAFPTPIFVRVIPPAEWRGAEPFRVIVEAGGLVSLRLRGGDIPEEFLRRGIVQALLMRQAVALHGVRSSLFAPLWLEIAGVFSWRVSEAGSELDALQQESANQAVPALPELLDWQRGGPEPRERMVAAFWLLAFLRAESSQGEEWRRFLGELLVGATPEAALAASFPGRFTDDAERELWWTTGWHHHRRAPALPLLGAAESRARIADATRLVVTREGREVVLAIADWRAFARSADGRETLRRQAAQLERRLPALHPFYRNAALSLMGLFAALEATRGSVDEFDRALRVFDQDWRDASELEAESARALDAWERR